MRLSPEFSKFDDDPPRAWDDEEESAHNMDQPFEYSEQIEFEERNRLHDDMSHRGFKDKLDDRRERGRPIQRAVDTNHPRSRDYPEDYQYETGQGHRSVGNTDDIQDQRQRSASAEPLPRKPLDDYEPIPHRFGDKTTSYSNKQYASPRRDRNSSSTYQSRERDFHSRERGSEKELRGQR